MVSRRTFIGAVGSAGLAIPLVASCSNSDAPAGHGHPPVDPNIDFQPTIVPAATAVPTPFTLPFRVPPVLAPTSTDATTDYYDVTARTANATIVPGTTTQIFGYNGIFPGPTIESRSGRRVVVRTTNQLPVPIATHLHGGHTPAASDGYPTDLILPTSGWSGHTHGGVTTNGTREYVYPNTQRAATLWYHDHRMDFTGPSVWRGLAGMHIIRDAEDDALPLPKGLRDVPLMIMDRTFNPDGSFWYPSIDPNLQNPPGASGTYHNGVTGNVILVNGVPWPVMQVEAVKYRFRILNASNSRRYRLSLSPAPTGVSPFIQVGSDGGLLETPNNLTTIYCVPGERYDVVIDFSKYAVGTTITMKNSLGETGTNQIMQFKVVKTGTDTSTIPSRLSTYPKLDPAQAVRTRTFVLKKAELNGQERHWINDRLFDPNYIMANPRLGETEIWAFTANTGHHPAHVHLNHFQILSREGGLEPEDKGLKDTIRLTPGDEVRVLVKFTEHRGKYVIHCHNLEHEDVAMMANFEVI